MSGYKTGCKGHNGTGAQSKRARVIQPATVHQLTPDGRYAGKRVK